MRFFFLKFVDFYFVCMVFSSVYVCALYCEVPTEARKALISLELELQMPVSHHVGAEN